MRRIFSLRNTGFTIVELLIVIVVIAILATITLVTYNGIQNRAHDSATASNLRQVMNGLEIMHAQTGSYYNVPETTAQYQVCIGTPPVVSAPCSTATVTGTNCGTWSETGIDYNDDFNNSLKEYLGTTLRSVQSKPYTQTMSRTNCVMQSKTTGAIYKSALQIDVYRNGSGSITSLQTHNSTQVLASLGETGTGAYSITYAASNGSCIVPNSNLVGSAGSTQLGEWTLTYDSATCVILGGDIAEK